MNNQKITQKEVLNLAIKDGLEHAIRLREATPGKSSDGFYPATTQEIADEVVNWINGINNSIAPGLKQHVLNLLWSTQKD